LFAASGGTPDGWSGHGTGVFSSMAGAIPGMLFIGSGRISGTCLHRLAGPAIGAAFRQDEHFRGTQKVSHNF
jgi:hypothetical protein